MLTAIDLFSGAGGLTEGLKRAGYSVLGAVELDPLACATYRENHPKTFLWESDIKAVRGTQILKGLGLGRGEVDLLAACPPCQGYSTMRTKNGGRRNRDPRKSLILEVLRLARSMRPKAIMVENVPGLAKSAKFRAFQRGLESMGYTVISDVLNTVHYGVPQRRRRLVVLASRVSVPAFAARSKRTRTVRDAIGSLSTLKGRRDPLHQYAVGYSPKVRNLIRQIPRDGGSRSSLKGDAVLECHKRVQGFKDVYGRMAWGMPAPTITGGCINPSKGRFLHPTKNRAVTLREAALLQTFPAKYRFCMDRGRYAAALMIGNALPPEFIRRHAIALKKTLE